MRTFRHLIPAALLAVALVGCSDPRDTPLPADIANLESIKPQVDKLPEADRALLGAYLVRRSIGGILPGMARGTPPTTAATIGEAIDQQRAFTAERDAREATAKAEVAKLKAERAEATKWLSQIVSVALVSKSIDVKRGYGGMELDRTLQVSFAFKNNSDKDIAGVKGLVTARDLFGDEISGFQISNDSTIKAGATLIWSGGRSIKFAVADNKDEKLAELPEDKFTIEWAPQVIVFADGTKAAVK